MGLLDFLQGASNTAASSVAAPVDLLNSGLGLLGLASQEPVGGSKWMRRHGLTKDPSDKRAGLLGEIVGTMTPLAAVSAAPKIASTFIKAADNAALPASAGHAQRGAVALGSRESAMQAAQANATRLLGLPKNNTALDRARALGFTTEAYRGTTAAEKATRRAPYGAMGPAVYTGNSPIVAEQYASGAGANVMPLLLNGKYASNKEWTDIINKVGWEGAEAEAKRRGFAGVDDKMFEDAYAVFDPKNVRSRFAAFDPMKINSRDLLGRSDLGLLGALGAASGAAAFLKD